MNARLIALSRRGSTKLAVIRIIDTSVGLAIRDNIRTVHVQLWGIYDPQNAKDSHTQGNCCPNLDSRDYYGRVQVVDVNQRSLFINHDRLAGRAMEHNI